MTRTCPLCRRINPEAAAFCYHDGCPLAALDDEEVKSLDAGARLFTTPFVFPAGRSCRNFDELALACHESPKAAVDVLAKGYLGHFLATQGRADLAEAANAIERASDRELALDDFLGLLPTTVLTPARLRVEPLLIDLGTLAVGQDRRCEVVLFNDGMRLLTGSVRCEDTLWLSLGDGPAQRGKLFQVTGRTTLAIRVLGRHLRGYQKPQEAEIVIESNAGAATVLVRIHVPVFPFPEGELAGVSSPREMAERMLAAPHVASASIESGAVARWYASNGWTYPVLGQSATGTAAIQQLFESLGLAKPPRLEISEDFVSLLGESGGSVEYVLSVVTEEKRAVVAHGSSDQPWLHIGPTVFRGRSAFVPLSVSRVPGAPGEIHRAKVTITGNGNQHFVVPVTLVTVPRKGVDSLPPPVPLPPPPVSAPRPVSLPSLPPPSQAAPNPPASLPSRPRHAWKETRSNRPLWLALLAVLVVLAAIVWWFTR